MRRSDISTSPSHRSNLSSQLRRGVFGRVDRPRVRLVFGLTASLRRPFRVLRRQLLGQRLGGGE